MENGRHIVNPLSAIIFKKLRDAEAVHFTAPEKYLGIQVNYRPITAIVIFCKREAPILTSELTPQEAEETEDAGGGTQEAEGMSERRGTVKLEGKDKQEAQPRGVAL
ncbi:hypothetical protein P3T25_009439 [Paraburkholderia sp. GAS32]